MMINGIVRPPRAKYSINQLGTKSIYLGNKVINIKDKIFMKEDFNVEHQGKHLELTLYQSVA
jgi:hypothetical protein